MLPPGYLPRSVWAGNNMTSFGQLIYPKERCWGQRFFPRSENKFAEVGRGSGRAAHDSPPGIWSSHKRLTHRWRPVGAKNSFGHVFYLLGIELSISIVLTLRDARKFSNEHDNILKIKLTLILFICKILLQIRVFLMSVYATLKRSQLAVQKVHCTRMKVFVFVSEVSKFIGNRDISLIWTKGKKQMIFKIFVYGLYMKIMTTENNGKPPR